MLLSIRREGSDGMVGVRSGSTGRRGHEMAGSGPVIERGM